MPGSFFSLERHSGFFLASFLSFLCFAADFFSILCRKREVPRFDLGSRGKEKKRVSVSGVGKVTGNDHDASALIEIG